jgi:hypothetical protein
MLGVEEEKDEAYQAYDESFPDDDNTADEVLLCISILRRR